MADELNPSDATPADSSLVPVEPKKWNFSESKGGKKRMNPVLFFPPKILDEVNKAIDDGWRSPHIYNILKDRWSQDLKKIPCIMTIGRYITWYEDQQKMESGDTIGEIQQNTRDIQKGLETVLDPKVTTMDKKQILELLIRKCGDRIRTLERWQKTTISPAFENCLVRYFAEVRALIETLAKLNHELQPDNQVIVNVVESRIQPIFMAFYNVIKQLCPDQIEKAKYLLKEEMRRISPQS